MKKLLFVLLASLFCISAQAQKKGDFAAGVRGSVSFSNIKILDVDDNFTQFGIGGFAQYNFANNWRVEAEANFHPMKDHVSDVLVALNLHYLFRLVEGVKLYPILGYGVAFVHNEKYTEGGVTVESDNETDGGFQVGLGLQVDLGDKWFAAGEYKFQPGIFGDAHVVMAGIGFRF